MRSARHLAAPPRLSYVVFMVRDRPRSLFAGTSCPRTVQGGLRRRTLKAVTVALVGLLLSLAGCASLHEADRIGEGPLTLSPTVAEGFERYKRGYKAGYFAVSADGRSWGGWGCGAVYDRCWGVASAAKAIEQCEKYSSGVPCYTFAIDNRIVWRGYDQPPSTSTSFQSPRVTTTASSAKQQA